MKLHFSFAFALLFASNASYAQLRDISVPPNLQLNKADPAAAKAQLAAMNVKYLWKMDGSDASRQNQQLVISDFMGNSSAHTESGLVSVQDCYDKGVLQDSFVLFQRPTPDYPVGGSLKVSETTSSFSKLEANSEFTIGGWFKQYPNFMDDFKFIEPGKIAGGYMPALTRFAKSTPLAGNGMEWIFHMTPEIAYVNINRGFTGQNDMNVHVPWWAHTYGTCYQGGYHKECWHYISVAVNPAQNTVQFVISRQPGYFMADGDEVDFLATGITNAQLNNTAITHFKDSILQIAAGETEGTHGLIRGLFFARKALSPQESKAISTYTAPNFKNLHCTGGLNLTKRSL
jgi:hypothetical protein